jgi:hypothetical protein
LTGAVDAVHLVFFAAWQHAVTVLLTLNDTTVRKLPSEFDLVANAPRKVQLLVEASCEIYALSVCRSARMPGDQIVDILGRSLRLLGLPPDATQCPAWSRGETYTTLPADQGDELEPKGVVA